VKKLISTSVLILSVSVAVLAITENDTAGDAKAIEHVIEKYYMDVVFRRGDLNDLAKGFHAEFNMYYLGENEIHKSSLQGWTERLTANREKSSRSKKPHWSHKVKLVDVTGQTGLIKIELYREAKLRFTDYLSLYKFDEGWRVMAKLFTEHE
jgi:hypothetical protein